MSTKKEKSALVLLSGGQDSTTCLAWALKNFQNVHAIAFDYNQRHKIELKSAEEIARITGINLRILKTDLFKELTDNALLNDQTEINEGDDKNPPNTFVDGRNMIFLSIASIYAKQLNIHNLITGVCQTDYSGYPDCREEFINSMEKTATLAMDYDLKIHTPLMWLTKAQTVKLMEELGSLELLKYSHTCYKGMRPACGDCPACRLRLKGFEEAGIKDPLPYQND